jgi:hypothetical protein
LSFSAKVERWRDSARKWSAWSSELNHVALDESDVLALINRESGGDPEIVSPTGYRGLGQIGVDALLDYNNAMSEPLQVPLAWLTSAEHGDEQARVIAWHMARGRTLVSAWGMPDAVANAALWSDARYAWGAGNLRKALARFKSSNGRLPTFDELALAEPNAGWSEKRQKFNVRPWIHARAIVASALRDRNAQKKNPSETLSAGEAGQDVSPSSSSSSIAAIVLAIVGGSLVALGIGFQIVRTIRSKDSLDR